MKIIFNEGDVYGVVLHKVELLCIGAALASHSTITMNDLIANQLSSKSALDIKTAFGGQLHFAHSEGARVCMYHDWPSAPYSIYACIHTAAQNKIAGVPIC